MSSGEEIRRYLDDTADHFGAKGNTRFNTEVREAVWLEGEQGPNSIEYNYLEFWLAKWFEFWLDIPH